MRNSTYTFMINLLHFPAGVVPVTRVREEEAVYPMAGKQT